MVGGRTNTANYSYSSVSVGAVVSGGSGGGLGVWVGRVRRVVSSGLKCLGVGWCVVVVLCAGGLGVVSCRP